MLGCFASNQIIIMAPRNKSSRKRIKKIWTSQNFDFKKAIFLAGTCRSWVRPCQNTLFAFRPELFAVSTAGDGRIPNLLMDVGTEQRGEHRKSLQSSQNTLTSEGASQSLMLAN